MANTNAPRGFQPRKTGTGQAWAGVVNTYKIASGYATNIFKGDPVKLLTTGFINKAGATDQIRGVAVGFKWIDAAGDYHVQAFWPSGTVTQNAVAAEIMVIDDPDTVFEAQFTNSTTVPTQADVGATFASFDAGGQTAGGGLSGVGVDYATLGTSANQWRFLGFSTSAANDTTAAGGANSYGYFVPALHDFHVNTGI